MSNNINDLELVNLDENFRSIKTIEKRKWQWHTQKQSYREQGKNYRAITYFLDQVKPEQKLKIKKEIREYNNANIENLSRVKYICFDARENKSTITIICDDQKETLLNFFKEERQKMTEQNIIRSMNQLAISLYQLHKNKLTHNSINLQSIFLRENGCTFGLPHFRSIQKWQLKQKILFIQDKKNIYLAPQISEGWSFSQSSDIWDLGMVFLQLIFGRSLQIQINRDDKFEEHISQQIKKIGNLFLKKLISLMLQFDREKRITAFDLIEYLETLGNEKEEIAIPTAMFTFTVTDIFPFSTKVQDLCKFKNKFQLDSALFSEYQNVKFYEMRQDNVIEKIIISIDLVNFKLQMGVSSSSLQYSAQRCIFDINGLINIAKKRNLILKMTEQGKIEAEISEQQYKQYQQTAFQKIEKLKRVQRLITRVTNERAEWCDGLLIGRGLVLTSASIARMSQQKVKSGFLKVESKMTQNSISEQTSSFSYFFIEEKNENENIEPDCAVIELYQQVWRYRYMALVSNYNEQVTFQKLKKMNKATPFYYQAGDHIAIKQDDIKFLENNMFQVSCPLNQKVKKKVKKGCPLLVVFQHNQCYAIGMFQSEQKGLLFGDRFYWFIWNCVLNHLQNINSGAHRGTIRMLEWSRVELDKLQPLYCHATVQFKIQREEDYLPKEISAENLFLTKKLIGLRQQEGMLGIGQLSAKIKKSEEIIECLEKLYGPDCELISIQCYYSMIFIHNSSAGMVEEKNNSLIIRHLERAAETEGRHQRNMAIYSWSLVKIPEFNSIENLNIFIRNKSFSDRKKTRQCLKKVEEFTKKVKCSGLIELLNKYFSLFCVQEGNMSQAAIYSQRSALAAKNGNAVNSVQVNLQTSTLYRGINNLPKAVKYLMRAFQAYNKMAQNNFMGAELLKDTFMREWQMLSTLLLSSSNIPIETIDQFIELTKRFVKEKWAELGPVFECKKKQMHLF